MNFSREDVLQAALKLSEAERIQLVDELIATLEPEDAAPLDDAWLAEIDRRARELDSGSVALMPWSVVKERARHRGRNDGPA